MFAWIHIIIQTIVVVHVQAIKLQAAVFLLAGWLVGLADATLQSVVFIYHYFFNGLNLSLIIFIKYIEYSIIGSLIIVK